MSCCLSYGGKSLGLPEEDGRVGVGHVLGCGRDWGGHITGGPSAPSGPCDHSCQWLRTRVRVSLVGWGIEELVFSPTAVSSPVAVMGEARSFRWCGFKMEETVSQVPEWLCGAASSSDSSWLCEQAVNFCSAEPQKCWGCIHSPANIWDVWKLVTVMWEDTDVS